MIIIITNNERKKGRTWFNWIQMMYELPHNEQEVRIGVIVILVIKMLMMVLSQQQQK